MKKKAILGFMTGAAIVAATTGSYAAWDTLKLSHSGKLTIAKPVTVTTTLTDGSYQNQQDNENTRVLGVDAPVYTVDMPISIQAGTSHDVDLALDATVEGMTEATVTTDLYDKDGTNKIDSLQKIDDGEYTVRTTITMPNTAPDSLPEEISVITTAELTSSTPSAE